MKQKQTKRVVTREGRGVQGTALPTVVIAWPPYPPGPDKHGMLPDDGDPRAMVWDDVTLLASSAHHVIFQASEDDGSRREFLLAGVPFLIVTLLDDGKSN